MPDNGIVYHYCSLETFKSIIENKCLWLCDVQKSNDSAELIYFDNIMLDQIHHYTEYLSNGNHTDKERELQALQLTKEVLQNPAADRAPVYSCSFSYNDDMLSQWRGYADDGYGVAIGFAARYFERQLPSITFGRVNYCRADAQKLCETILKKSFENCQTEVNKNSEDAISYNSLFVLNVLQSLEKQNIFFKSPAFAEEQECRIAMRLSYSHFDTKSIHFSLSHPNFFENDETLNFSMSSKKFRVVHHRFSSYYELSFDKIKNKLICSIMLGPKNQNNPRDIIDFLENCGYNTDRITIERSSATYR